MVGVGQISRKGTAVPRKLVSRSGGVRAAERVARLVSQGEGEGEVRTQCAPSLQLPAERLSAWFAYYRQLHEPAANLDAV
jgi:hypothetical protein